MSKKHKVRVAEIFFALGDERRLSVLAKLQRGALSATALADGAGVTRQAIVKHLQVLDGAGLVAHRKCGREVLYTPDTRRLDEARAFLEMISAGWDRAIDRLTDMVEGQSRPTPKKRRR
jgi:DNA-binding transcriptional ArsR family regulator